MKIYRLGLVIVLFVSCRNAGGASSQTAEKKSDIIDNVNRMDLSGDVEYNKANSSRVIYDSAYKITKSLSDSTYEEDIFLVYKRLCIEIKSIYLDDSVTLEESNLFNPVCLRQQLFFYRDHELRKVQDHPVNKVVQKVYSGRKVEMAEDVITEAGLIKGRKGLLFVTEGYGGCSTCSEFYGLYSGEGDRLWYVYRTNHAIIKEMGDVGKVFSDYGADEKEMNKSMYSKVNIY